MTESVNPSNQLEQSEFQLDAHEFNVQMKVDPLNMRYPYCLVWTAIPCLTCCLPCIGHTGIGKSDGTIFDFVGRGPIHSGQLAFGAPLKYFILKHDNIAPQKWDTAIDQTNQKFCKTSHDLCCNNCHHHVAQVLNNLNYDGRSNWDQINIAILAFRGTHVSFFSYWVYAVFLIIVFILII